MATKLKSLRGAAIATAYLVDGATVHGCYGAAKSVNAGNSESIEAGEGGLFVKCRCRAGKCKPRFIPWISISDLEFTALEDDQ